MIALLLTTFALADCPPLVTVPEDGEEDVPPGLTLLWVGPSKALEWSSGPCQPDRVSIVREGDPDDTDQDDTGDTDAPGETLDGAFDSSSFTLPPLEPDSTYTVTLERPRNEPTVVTFHTGAAREATPLPTPELLDTRAWRAKEAVCAEVTARVEGTDRWMIIQANVGQPFPWVRAEDGDQTVTLSTADAHRSSWAGRRGCGPDRFTDVDAIVMVQSLMGPVQNSERVPTRIQRVSDPALCPPAPPVDPTIVPDRCSALAAPSGSALGLLGALLVALLRRRRSW